MNRRVFLLLCFCLLALTGKAQVLLLDSVYCVNPETEEKGVVSLNFRVTASGTRDQLEVEIRNYPGYDKSVVLNFCKYPYVGESRLMRLESGVWCISSTIKHEVTYLLIGDIDHNSNDFAAMQIECRDKNKNKVNKYPYNLILPRGYVERIHEFISDCLEDGVLEEKRM